MKEYIQPQREGEAMVQHFQVTRLLGRRIAARRKSLGLNQAAFSEKCGISVGWLSKIERGQAGKVSLPTIAAIERALELPTGDRQHGETLQSQDCEEALLLDAWRQLPANYRESALKLLRGLAGNHVRMRHSQ
jgi:transcriptional regulator with XRE-family HTH domain